MAPTNQDISADPTQPIHSPTQLQDTQIWKGHKYVQNDHTLFTIGFTNLNGISGESKTSMQTKLHDTAATLEHLNISLLGASEHHLAMSNPKRKQRIYELERRIHKELHTKFFLHSSKETTTNDRRLMGGTGIIALKSTIGRLCPNACGGDDMGRWTYVHLQRANGRTLTVVSIYQVCHTPTNKQGGTAWHQQRRALDGQNGLNEHPREAFITDLTNFLGQLKDKNHDLIVGGDWNETLTEPRSKVLRMSLDIGLIDPWIHFHPEHNEFATHERGSQRIDFILVSHSLLPTIQNVCYSPVGMINNSDH